MGKEGAAQIDSILLMMVRATNSAKDITPESSPGLGLVLTVCGATISGNLIPNWLWFKRVEENLRKSTKSAESTSSGLADVFNLWSDELITLREEEAQTSRVLADLPPSAQQALRDNDSTGFIHLGNARVYQPGYPGLPSNGMLWRGHLKDISGWSLGMFDA